jgi:hypothetical protein
MDAYRGSLEADDQTASAAARAASLAAASAYTHPFVDVNQAKHILGPAAYTAWAIEIQYGLDHGASEVRRAVEKAGNEVINVLLIMPCQPLGKTRLDTIMYELDTGLRGKLA